MFRENGGTFIFKIVIGALFVVARPTDSWEGLIKPTIDEDARDINAVKDIGSLAKPWTHRIEGKLSEER